MCVPIFRKSSNALMRSRRNISSPLKAYGYGQHYPVKYRIIKSITWAFLVTTFHFLYLILLCFSLCVSFRIVEPFSTVLLKLFFVFLPCRSLFHSILMFSLLPTLGLPHKYSVFPQVFHLSDYIISI